MFWEEKREFEKDVSKDSVKEAFAKVKTDIFTLGKELSDIRSDMLDLKNALDLLNESINSMKIDILNVKNTGTNFRINELNPTHYPTEYSEKPTYSDIPSNNPTVPCEIGGLKYPNFNISSGNEGVPTDRQTNQQTDNYEEIQPFNKPNNSPGSLNKHIHDASKILDSLDSIKKEIRLKFKQMTNQEMLVFSTIYLLEEQFPEGIEYRQIAAKLKLSESSIRDYTQKLIGKGIPVDKIKLNNKKILLKISSKLKTIAPLDTIMKLREL